MGVRQRKRETIERLAEKTLEARFVGEVTAGLNCSPFEARAVLGVVQEVFAPLWREASRLPGRMVLMAVDAEEPAGKAVHSGPTRARRACWSWRRWRRQRSSSSAPDS